MGSVDGGLWMMYWSYRDIFILIGHLVWDFITLLSSSSQWLVSGELTNQSMSMPSSSGISGVSLSTVVNKLTAETVASSRKIVSKIEHWWMGLQKCRLKASGSSIVARVQSTAAWWKINPWDHLFEQLEQALFLLLFYPSFLAGELVHYFL